ncbi:hypothetical protein BGX21_011461 [Mortierella sp. AD011]|nr:hypothetical protein BGX20_003897 [Mortierella sp. AD010]KAF9402037.1 hypothetical protein BGX21_011461 [Mortierella sp. AD011]
MTTSGNFPLLVVLNPQAGRKQGREQFSMVIQPALERSGTSFRLIETNAGGHAQSYFKDFTQSVALSEVESVTAATSHLSETEGVTATTSQPIHSTIVTLRIMVVGGDGTVHEIVNGVIEGLTARSSSISSNRLNIELSVIPAGTGNAIATSLGIASVQDAVDRFLGGTSVPLQVIKVSKRFQENSAGTVSDHSVSQAWKAQVYTVVVNSFGLHCATVRDAEGLRFLGNERFKIAALKNIILLKQYEGRIDLYGPVQQYDRSLREMVAIGDGATEVSTSHLSRSLKGPFTYLLLTKQASLEPGFLPTPFARTSDEWIDVLAVQNVGRNEILQVLGDATRGGQHINHEKVEYYKAKVIEFETPIEGRLCVDGEFLDVKAGPQGRLRFEIALEPLVQLFHI